MLKLKYLKTIKGVGCNSSGDTSEKFQHREREISCLYFIGVALPPLWGASP